MPWMPRSPKEQAADLVWLPRLIDKARRVQAGLDQGVDLITPYMYGDNDYMDGIQLRFLRLRDAQVLEIVRGEADDEKAARAIAALSGRSPEECRRWSARFLQQQALWVFLIEVDEGRICGPTVQAAHWFYNQLVFPPAQAAFRWMEARRAPAGTEGTRGA